MEQELTCPVCLDLYSEPLFLPCSHSLCHKCLLDMVVTAEKRVTVHTGEEEEDLYQAPEYPKCPSCRRDIQVTRDTVGNLPPNLILKNIVVQFKKTLNLDPREDQQAVLDQQERIFKDRNGVEVMANGRHPGLYGAEGHLVGDERRWKVKCKVHVLATALLFCYSCQKLICNLCVSEDVGKHADHEVEAIEDAYQKVQTTLNKVQRDTHTLLLELEAQARQLSSLTDDIQGTHQRSLEAIEDQVISLHVKIRSILETERDVTVQKMKCALDNVTEQRHSLLTENGKLCEQLEKVCASSKVIAIEEPEQLLPHVAEVSAINSILEKTTELTNDMKVRCQQTSADTSALTAQYEGVHSFFTNAVKAVTDVYEAIHIKVGDRVIWHTEQGHQLGTARWLGASPCLQDGELMVGIECDKAVGSGNGECGGRHFMKTEENHALFLHLKDVVNYKDLPNKYGIKVGDRVKTYVRDKGKQGAKVLWLGLLPDHQTLELIAGLEFDEPVGVGNGNYNGDQIFEAKLNHASLVPLRGLIPSDASEQDMPNVFFPNKL